MMSIGNFFYNKSESWLNNARFVAKMEQESGGAAKSVIFCAEEKFKEWLNVNKTEHSHAGEHGGLPNSFWYFLTTSEHLGLLLVLRKRSWVSWWFYITSLE